MHVHWCLPVAVPKCADLEPQPTEIDEALGVLLLVHAVGFERSEIHPVERSRRTAPGHGEGALVELEPDRAGHVFLDLVDESLQRLALRRKPEAVVDHLRVSRYQGVAKVE